MSQPEADSTEGGDDGEIARVPSFVPGLDAVLCGGFLQGGVYMVLGPPGAGKTILSNQIIYSRAAAEGDRALFVTVLGENHGRMLAHLRPMRFFDSALLPERVTYISAYQALDKDGLEGLAALILREVRARGAALLVLDGMSVVEAKAGATFEIKRFTQWAADAGVGDQLHDASADRVGRDNRAGAHDGGRADRAAPEALRGPQRAPPPGPQVPR